MHRTDPARWRHDHDYAADSASAERRTRVVIGITAAMMAVEIAAIVSIVAHDPRPGEACRDLLRAHEELVHLTIEIRPCGQGNEVPVNA